MSSDTEASPRARFRFGFSGKRKRPEQLVDAHKVSTDDLLESLTRHASSQVGFGDTRQKGFEVLAEEDVGVDVDESMLPVSPMKVPTSKSVGRFAFVLMLLGGLFVVGLYSWGTLLPSLSTLNNLTQITAIRSVFTNPSQIGIISLFALVAAVWVAHRRKNSTLQMAI